MDGVWEGEGSYYFHTGDVYTGQYHKGKRHGEGVYYFASGLEVYDGMTVYYCTCCVNLVCQVCGLMILLRVEDCISTPTMACTRENSTRADGKARELINILTVGETVVLEMLLRLHIGETYDGIWKQDKRHGHGMHKFRNGKEYLSFS